MKSFIQLIGAGFIGACIAFGIFSWNGTNSYEGPFLDHSKAHLVNDLNVSPSLAGTMDFVDASKSATEAVVHIYAEESDQLAMQRRQQQAEQQRRRDPFGGFFDMNDFFGGDIFGQNFYRPKNGTGSGVIISDDGYIVTNNHVVGFADYILVTLADGRKIEAEKIGTDPSTDLAVIKIKESNLKEIGWGDSEKVQIGEWVLAVGNPFDLTSTVTAGIVSAKGRDLNIIKGEKTIEEFIQTDAAVNPGNSGGALVDAKGNLIGINTAIATPTGVYAGYSFAIPSNLVKRIVDDIMEYGGSIERTNLGIYTYDIDKSLKEEMKLKVDEGVFVDAVEKRSAAQFAGIIPGDVITAIDGTRIKNGDDLVELMKYKKVGDVLNVDVVRKNKKKTIPVALRKGI